MKPTGCSGKSGDEQKIAPRHLAWRQGKKGE